MAYTEALLKAWSQLDIGKDKGNFILSFLSEDYSIDVSNKTIHCLLRNVPAKEYVSILMLHYLYQQIRGLPALIGEWISFNQLEGGEYYYSVFNKRVIEPIKQKYGFQPKALAGAMQRFRARQLDMADISFMFDVFPGIPMLITLWCSDDEFGPEANILFDKSIKQIFCTEDVAMIAGIIAHSI